MRPCPAPSIIGARGSTRQPHQISRRRSATSVARPFASGVDRLQPRCPPVQRPVMLATGAVHQRTRHDAPRCRSPDPRVHDVARDAVSSAAMFASRWRPTGLISFTAAWPRGRGHRGPHRRPFRRIVRSASRGRAHTPRPARGGPRERVLQRHDLVLLRHDPRSQDFVVELVGAHGVGVRHRPVRRYIVGPSLSTSRPSPRSRAPSTRCPSAPLPRRAS